MSEWEDMREAIRRATAASRDFQLAGEAVEADPTPGEIEVFAKTMLELQKEMQNVLKLLTSGTELISDEAADVFSRLVLGHPLRYRITPRPPASASKTEGDLKVPGET